VTSGEEFARKEQHAHRDQAASIGLYAQTRSIIHRAAPHYPSRLLRVYNHPGIFFVVRVPCMYSVFIGLALGVLGVCIAYFHTSKTLRWCKQNKYVHPQTTTFSPTRVSSNAHPTTLMTMQRNSIWPFKQPSPTGVVKCVRETSIRNI